MNLYTTMNYPFEEECFRSKIKELYNIDGVKGIRVNLCRYEKNTYEKAVNFLVKMLKEPAKKYHLAFDLPYPCNKSRIIDMDINDKKIIQSEQYYITVDKPASGKDIQVGGISFSENVKSGDILYYGDGDGSFEVVEVKNERLTVVALDSFTIWKDKAITGNLVHNSIEIIRPLMDLTQLAVDKERICFFPSFVTTQKQVDELKKIVDKKALVIPKIECFKERKEINKTIRKSDGALLARGDMVYYMGLTNILKIEKYVGQAIRKKGKRLFVATDILESLQRNTMPFRSDIIDVCVLNEIGCTDLIISNAFVNIERVIALLKLFE